MNKTLDFDQLWAQVPESRGGKSPVQIIGIRGALEASSDKNRYDIYDDLIVVRIGGVVRSYVASTEPSKYLVLHPINSEGAARLCPGIHLMSKHNMHGDSQKPALCQSEDVHVERLNSDGTVSHLDYGQFGICIHSGGAGTDTGRFSAGCQIINNPNGYFGNPFWHDLITWIYQGMDANKITTVPYLLFEDSGYARPA